MISLLFYLTVLSRVSVTVTQFLRNADSTIFNPYIMKLLKDMVGAPPSFMRTYKTIIS